MAGAGSWLLALPVTLLACWLAGWLTGWSLGWAMGVPCLIHVKSTIAFFALARQVSGRSPGTMG